MTEEINEPVHDLVSKLCKEIITKSEVIFGNIDMRGRGDFIGNVLVNLAGNVLFGLIDRKKGIIGYKKCADEFLNNMHTWFEVTIAEKHKELEKENGSS